MLRHFVFDAYGTLFNVHAAAERYKDVLGPRWQQLSQTWRVKHIEYTWVHSLAGRQTTFWSLAERSLDYAAATVGGIPAHVRDQLLASYRTMDAYPEVREVLAALKAKGAKLAILSNGDPDMLAEAVRAAKLDGLLDDVLSVAAAGVFKPSPAVYRLATDHYGCRPQDISFQSSNRWDIAGAKAFGFHCVWINRTDAPDEYPEMKPDRVARDLRALLAGS
jgi:2-haloacid dehalogenase